MARKRLNKKLITILSLVGLTILVIGVVLVVSRKFRSAQPFLDEAKVLIENAKAINAANEAQAAQLPDPEESFKRLNELNEEKAEKIWKEAIENLKSAFHYARTNYDLKNQALEEMVEVYLYRKEYTNVMGVWNEMFKLDATNYDAKRKMAEFYYEMARNGATQNWREVRDQSDLLIQLRPEDAYGYLLKAHALIGMVTEGASEDPVQAETAAEELIAKAAGLQPENPILFRVRAFKELLKLKNISDPKEQRRIQDQAGAYLKEGIEANPSAVDVYQDLFEIYYLPLLRDLYTQAARAGEDTKNPSLAEFDQVAQESEGYLEKAREQFPEDGRFYIFQSQVHRLGLLVREQDWLNDSIALVEKSLACPKKDGAWYILAADYYRQRAQETRDGGRSDLEKAFSLLREAVYHSNLTDLQSAERVKVRRLRYGGALPLLVDIAADLADQESDTTKKQWYLSKAHGALKELQDSIGPDVATSKIAAGVVALAEGEKQKGIKYFYEADQQQRASGISNPKLDERLFYALREGEYQGLALQYAVRALVSGGRSERLLIDGMQTMLQLRGSQYLGEMSQFFDLYEKYYGKGKNYPEEYIAIRTNYYLRQGKYQEARGILADYRGEKEEFRILQARSLDTEAERLAASTALSLENPSNLNLVNMLYTFYISEGTKDPSAYEQARKVIDAALAVSPENLSLQQMRGILSEPDPGAVTEERKREISLGVINAIADPLEKSREQGQFFLNQGFENQARGNEDQAKKDFELAKKELTAAARLAPEDQAIQISLFRTALAQKDWPTAKNLVGTISGKDPVLGLSVEADLNIAQENWEAVARVLERYLQERPVSAQGHANLAQAYIQLAIQKQKENADKDAELYFSKAQEQARESFRQDSQNIRTMNLLASLIHQGNEQKGLENLGMAEITEMVSLVEKALDLNLSNEMMIRLGAIYYPLWTKSQSESLAAQKMDEQTRKSLNEKVSRIREKSISITRSLTSQNPQQAENWQLLAQLVYQYSQQEPDPGLQDKMLAEVDKIYQDGMAANPNSPQLAAAYGEFLRKIGKEEKAEDTLLDMIAKSEGAEKIQAQLNLAAVYYRHREFSQARKVVEDILQTEEKNVAALRMQSGILLQEGDYEAALDVYQKLRQIDDQEDLAAGQIEALLALGQVEEAEGLLQEMQKKYPDYMGTQLLSARVELRKANYAAAIAYADQALQSNENNIQAYLLKAQAQYYDQQLSPALETLKVLRARVPAENSVGRMDIAKVYLAMERTDEAITELESALQYEPQNEPIRKMLLGIFRNLGRWSELERLYDDTIYVYSKSVNARLEAGDSALQMVRKYIQENDQDKAKEQMQRGVTLMSQAWQLSQESGEGQFPALLGMIRALQLAGQNQQIIEAVDKYASGQATDSLLLVSKAEALARLGKPEEALENYGKAMDLAEGKEGLEISVIDGAVRVGEFEKVEAWLQKKIAEQPDRVVWQMSLASLYRSYENYEKELTQLQNAQAKADAKKSLEIEQYLSIAYERTNQKEKAIESCRKILASDPDNITILNNLAYSLLEMGGRDEEALEYAQRAYQRARNSADIMDTYVVALLTKKDYAKAELLSRRAIQEKQFRNEPVTASFVFHLGQALAGQGRTEKAREQYDKALQILETRGEAVGESQLKEKIEQAMEKLDK